jgi:hypothetical protein
VRQCSSRRKLNKPLGGAGLRVKEDCDPRPTGVRLVLLLQGEQSRLHLGRAGVSLKSDG